MENQPVQPTEKDNIQFDVILNCYKALKDAAEKKFNQFQQHNTLGSFEMYFKDFADRALHQKYLYDFYARKVAEMGYDAEENVLDKGFRANHNVEWNINSFTEQLVSGNLERNSTDDMTNKAYRIERKAIQELIKDLKNILNQTKMTVNINKAKANGNSI